MRSAILRKLRNGEPLSEEEIRYVMQELCARGVEKACQKTGLDTDPKEQDPKKTKPGKDPESKGGFDAAKSPLPDPLDGIDVEKAR